MPHTEFLNNRVAVLMSEKALSMGKNSPLIMIGNRVTLLNQGITTSYRRCFLISPPKVPKMLPVVLSYGPSIYCGLPLTADNHGVNGQEHCEISESLNLPNKFTEKCPLSFCKVGKTWFARGKLERWGSE